MELDENLRKVLIALLSKWKLFVIAILIGAILGYVYTSNFTTLTYSSKVEFLAYTVDTEDEVSSSSSSSSSTSISTSTRTSNTSKMNYAMNMLPTYIEIISTNSFKQQLTDDLNERLNSSYSVATVGNSISVTTVDDTAMFKITVTTGDANLSYEIAVQLEETLSNMMEETNSGLVRASVQDAPLKATSAGSLGYGKKCALGAMALFALAAAYVVLRTILDVKVRESSELTERYNIPVLGTIPEFTFTQKTAAKNKKGDK